MRARIAYLIIFPLAVVGVLFYVNVNKNKIKLAPTPTPNPYSLAANASYKCLGSKTVEASFYNGPKVLTAQGEPPVPTGKVDLALSDGRTMSLPQTLSADGTRYANSDESIVFWSKGDTVFITENGKETYSCVVK